MADTQSSTNDCGIDHILISDSTEDEEDFEQEPDEFEPGLTSETFNENDVQGIIYIFKRYFTGRPLRYQGFFSSAFY